LTDTKQEPAGRRLRTPEAADYLGLSVSTLEKMRTTGGGPAFAAMGRAISYAVADLDAWAAARIVRNTSEARMRLPRRLTPPPASAARGGAR
jgi:predicted DNA-binding transcriptional regulator AlpA